MKRIGFLAILLVVPLLIAMATTVAAYDRQDPYDKFVRTKIVDEKGKGFKVETREEGAEVSVSNTGLRTISGLYHRIKAPAEMQAHPGQVIAVLDTWTPDRFADKSGKYQSWIIMLISSIDIDGIRADAYHSIWAAKSNPVPGLRQEIDQYYKIIPGARRNGRNQELIPGQAVKVSVHNDKPVFGTCDGIHSTGSAMVTTITIRTSAECKGNDHITVKTSGLIISGIVLEVTNGLRGRLVTIKPKSMKPRT